MMGGCTSLTPSVVLSYFPLKCQPSSELRCATVDLLPLLSTLLIDAICAFITPPVIKHFSSTISSMISIFPQRTGIVPSPKTVVFVVVAFWWTDNTFIYYLICMSISGIPNTRGRKNEFMWCNDNFNILTRITKPGTFYGSVTFVILLVNNMTGLIPVLCSEGREKMDAMFGTGTSLARQDTRTVTLASAAMWHLAVTVCRNDLSEAFWGMSDVARERVEVGVGVGSGVGEAYTGDRCQLKLWEGNEFLSSPRAANTPTTLLSWRSPFWPNAGRHPLWLPAVGSVSQWQRLNSSYSRHSHSLKSPNA